jgi:hypothetical protein
MKEEDREGILSQIALFGQTPTKLFTEPHPQRKYRIPHPFRVDLN